MTATLIDDQEVDAKKNIFKNSNSQRNLSE